MPCHITRLLAAPALMTVAEEAGTPSVPAIGSFCTPSSSTFTFEVLRVRRGVAAGPVQALDQVERADGAELRVSLPQATTSSRTRSGVGRFSESLQVLTNCPSLSRIDSARVTRLLSWLVSPPRAAASALRGLTVLPMRSPLGSRAR